MEAIRTFNSTGKKCTITVTFDDGTTKSIGGNRAARAAAVIVVCLGDRENDRSTDLGFGWHVDGARQTVASAESVARSIRTKAASLGGTFWGRKFIDVQVVVVHDVDAAVS